MKLLLVQDSKTGKLYSAQDKGFTLNIIWQFNEAARFELGCDALNDLLSYYPDAITLPANNWGRLD